MQEKGYLGLTVINKVSREEIDHLSEGIQIRYLAHSSQSTSNVTGVKEGVQLSASDNPSNRFARLIE